MFINIITPCSRPENLHEVGKSINIPRQNYRWIVVLDRKEEVDSTLLPSEAEVYYHTDPLSRSGNAQRNFALDLVKEGHILFNDDDTIIHPDFWEVIQKYVDRDFITYPQLWKNGRVRLTGTSVLVGQIDSHNFIVSKELVGKKRWALDIYEADGLFAEDCFRESKSSCFLSTPLSIYNYLRP